MESPTMNLAAAVSTTHGALNPDTLISLCEEAARGAERLLSRASAAVREKVLVDGGLSAELIEREQHACHGLSWLATYVEAIKQMTAYARRLSARGKFGELEALLTQIGV